jgi:hypothetical protein
MFKKVGAFYKRTYTAAFPTYEERHGYRGTPKRVATFEESAKWAALLSVTSLVALVLAVFAVLTIAAVFGPLGVTTLVFLAVVFGVAFAVSRII